MNKGGLPYDGLPGARLRRAAARASLNPTFVMVGSAVAQNFVRLASNVVLARLLAPSSFALTSITLLVMTAVQMISDVGITVLTLRHGPMGDRDEARIWTMQFVRGVGLSIGLLLLAMPAASMYGTPALAPVLAVLSVVPTIQGAQSLFPILALARQDLMPGFWVDVISRVGGATLSVFVALFHPNVWALVIGIIGQAVLATIISHYLGPKRLPTFDLDIAFIRQHWRFSRWIQLGSTLTFIASQVDKAVFPLLYGITRFGVYGIGANFALIPAQITQRWSGSIFYPLVVQTYNEGEPARARLRFVRITMLIYSCVVVIGVIAASPAFFYILYKPSYREAARFAAILAAASYFEVAESSLKHIPLAIGTSRYEFTAVLVRLGAFAIMVLGIFTLKGQADLYALAFTAAQGASYLFMLMVCITARYVTAGSDLLLAGMVAVGVLAAYCLPHTPASTEWAFLEGTLIAIFAIVVAGKVYLDRGPPTARLPSGAIPMGGKS